MWFGSGPGEPFASRASDGAVSEAAALSMSPVTEMYVRIQGGRNSSVGLVTRLLAG